MIAVKYACVKLELIESNIIAVATSISSLSTVSQLNRGVFLTPRFTGANREPLSAGRWDRGRTFNKVKLPNKPIKEGYKVWVLEDTGYVYD
jgi:hypothetical protein